MHSTTVPDIFVADCMMDSSVAEPCPLHSPQRRVFARIAVDPSWFLELLTIEARHKDTSN
jgi:hypothetical protein